MAKKPVKKITYYYRGDIGRPHYQKYRTNAYRWRPGYSEQGENGPVSLWLTYRECQQDARDRGCVAVFVKKGEENVEDGNV